MLNPFALYDFSRSPDESGPVYSIEQPEERESSEPSGKKLDKELKPGPVKTEIVEPLSQYDLSSYPSELVFFIYIYLSILHVDKMRNSWACGTATFCIDTLPVL